MAYCNPAGLQRCAIVPGVDGHHLSDPKVICAHTIAGTFCGGCSLIGHFETGDTNAAKAGNDADNAGSTDPTIGDGHGVMKYQAITPISRGSESSVESSS